MSGNQEKQSVDASLEADRDKYRFAFMIALRFIDTTDRESFEERFGQLSEDLAERVRFRAANSVFAFDGIIAELYTRGGYVGGWIALREWAERHGERSRWLNAATVFRIRAPPRIYGNADDAHLSA